MTNWDDIAAGSFVLMGLLQTDIAGSGRLSGPTDDVAEAKAVFGRHVERVIEQYGGRRLTRTGDGGSFMFRLSRSDDYTNMVLAAVMLLDSLEHINEEVALKTDLQQPLSVRISCDSGVLRYEPDPSNVQGDFVEKFLRHAPDVGRVNSVTISDRVRRELPHQLRNRFVFFKDSPEIGSKLYARAQRATQGGEPQPDEQDDDAVIAALNRALARNRTLAAGAEVIRLVRHVPHLEQGDLIWVDEEARRAAEERIRKKHDQFPNDAHAILAEEPAWDADPLRLRYNVTDYIGVEALSQGGAVPVEVLSANVVAVSSERREVYLHRRSEKSRTSPLGLHTFGGSYKPLVPNVRGDKDLVATAQREFSEESGMHFSRSQNPRLMIAKEPNTGFVQLVLLGVDLSVEEVEAKESSWEGEVVAVGFDKLPGRLLSAEENWVPTGWAHMVAWLGLGAPPLGPKERFAGLSAGKLYAQALAGVKA